LMQPFSEIIRREEVAPITLRRAAQMSGHIQGRPWERRSEQPARVPP